MMRIAIIGAHGVGKTTTITLLRRLPIFCNIRMIPSAREKLIAAGVPHSENGTQRTQEIYMEHCRTYACEDNEDLIFDRTVIDVLAYTYDLFEKGVVDYGFTLRQSDVISEFRRYLTDDDFIFLIEPEFPLPADGWRSSDTDHQKRINENMKKVLATFKIPHVTLRGRPWRRVFQIIKTIVMRKFTFSNF